MWGPPVIKLYNIITVRQSCKDFSNISCFLTFQDLHLEYNILNEKPASFLQFKFNNLKYGKTLAFYDKLLIHHLKLNKFHSNGSWPFSRTLLTLFLFPFHFSKNNLLKQKGNWKTNFEDEFIITWSIFYFSLENISGFDAMEKWLPKYQSFQHFCFFAFVHGLRGL